MARRRPHLDSAMRFWLINSLFWGCYVGLFMFQGMSHFGWSSGLALIAVLFGVSAACASASIARLVERGDWLALPAWKLALNLFGCIALAALGVQLLIFVVLRSALWMGWVQMPGGQSGYTPSSVLGYWLNTAILLALWSAVWIGWHALQRWRGGEAARQQAQRVQRALELDVLRGRLNPHFVFNALNNLRALILEDPQRARELVTRLSSTLRHALEHTPRQRVTLASELEVVADYLAVEAVHFEERLIVDQQIEPAALVATLPAMLLQLLVENAIKHGIANTPGGGCLLIRANSDKQGLHLEVSNPGHISTQRSGTGLGLDYLRAQLAQCSPAGCFELSEHGGRVCARLFIPTGEADAHVDR